MDESHFYDSAMSSRYWSGVGMRIFMPWSDGHMWFSMMCSMTADGRVFFDHYKTANAEAFLEHIDRVYKKASKTMLAPDRASYHTSKEATEYFRDRDIILV